MATRKKTTFQRIVDTIGELVRQPMSDESNEAPTPAAVRRSKAVAAGKRRAKPAAKARAKSKAKVKAKSKAKNRSTKKA